MTCHLNISACDVKFFYSPDLEFYSKVYKNQPFWHLWYFKKRNSALAVTDKSLHHYALFTLLKLNIINVTFPFFLVLYSSLHFHTFKAEHCKDLG